MVSVIPSSTSLVSYLHRRPLSQGCLTRGTRPSGAPSQRWRPAGQARREETTIEQAKVAVITGASQGIGAGLVRGYREAGYRVGVNSRTIQPSDDPDVLAVAGGIGLPEVAERVIAEGFEWFGRIDTLVNNAGIFTAKPFTLFTEEDWTANTSTNLAGFFFVKQQAIRRMEEAGSGHIVQITTSLVDQPISGVPSVLASLTKGGLNAATKSLATE